MPNDRYQGGGASPGDRGRPLVSVADHYSPWMGLQGRPTTARSTSPAELQRGTAEWGGEGVGESEGVGWGTETSYGFHNPPEGDPF